MEKKKILYSGLILFFICCGNAIIAYADYDYWDWEWRQEDIQPLYYKDYSGYDEVSTAVNDWNSVNCALDLSSGTGLQAIVWIYQVDLDSVPWCGITNATDTTGSYFDLVDVKLNDYYLSGYASNKIRSTINHELGHVHGLWHHPTSSIMIDNAYSRYDVYGIYVPQQYDEIAVVSLYGGD